MKAATSAATLGDLQSLVSDLQTGNAPVQLPDAEEAARLPSRSAAAGASASPIAAVLVVLGIGDRLGPVRQHHRRR